MSDYYQQPPEKGPVKPSQQPTAVWENAPAEEEYVPKRPAKSPRRGGGGLAKAALCLSLVAVILSGASLYFSLKGLPQQGEQTPEPPADSSEEGERPVITYRDRVLEVKEDVPANTLDRDGFYTDQSGRVRYEKDGREAKLGIDVSFYQGEIDWKAVAADGVEFAIIRLGYRGYTQGSLQPDNRFEENIKGALDAGLEVGVYFFSQALTVREAQDEAAYVLDAIRPYKVTYPVAFDWEFITPGSGARTDNASGEDISRCAAAFCEAIEEAGYEPAVYFNKDMGYLTYDLSQVAGREFWLASYAAVPDFYYGFSMWQYGHKGVVAGIQGDVDMDLDLRPVLAAQG